MIVSPVTSEVAAGAGCMGLALVLPAALSVTTFSFPFSVCSWRSI